MAPQPESALSHLECPLCGRRHEADILQNLCHDCGKPLLARYDLPAAARTLTLASLTARPRNLWRWAEVLPVRDPALRLTLGEGSTPLLPTPRLGAALGLPRLLVKDEGLNPTASFKARGMAAAVARARELGATTLSTPSAGNAAGALAAYAARAGMPARVYMPRDVPAPFAAECRALGAQVTLVDGLITDCGRVAAADLRAHGGFDLSTLKEPYRLEGKKTMGYELAEQLGWRLPDAIVYPTGGGTGLIGMAKAFDELEELGWIGSARPRLVTVQCGGCAPLVRAFASGDEFAVPWEGAATIADGLRVPSAVGDFLVLRALRATRGTAIAVSDAEALEGCSLLAREGIFAAPEGGATAAAARALAASGWLHPEETVLLFNTDSGHKHAHLWPGGA